MRYTATPTATKDYNSDGAIDSDDNALIVPGDDFGFSEQLNSLMMVEIAVQQNKVISDGKL